MRPKAIQKVVPMRTITNSASSGVYRPNWTPVRTEGVDHEAIPSRRSDGLYYRDGRREPLPKHGGNV